MEWGDEEGEMDRKQICDDYKYFHNLLNNYVVHDPWGKEYKDLNATFYKDYELCIDELLKEEIKRDKQERTFDSYKNNLDTQ